MELIDITLVVRLNSTLNWMMRYAVRLRHWNAHTALSLASKRKHMYWGLNIGYCYGYKHQFRCHVLLSLAECVQLTPSTCTLHRLFCVAYASPPATISSSTYILPMCFCFCFDYVSVRAACSGVAHFTFSFHGKCSVWVSTWVDVYCHFGLFEYINVELQFVSEHPTVWMLLSVLMLIKESWL